MFSTFSYLQSKDSNLHLHPLIVSSSFLVLRIYFIFLNVIALCVGNDYIKTDVDVDWKLKLKRKIVDFNSFVVFQPLPNTNN